jgi:cohesin complex subunit SCC1
MISLYNTQLNHQITFDDLLTKGSTRRTAAQKFYALLELKKWQAIEIEQNEPYGTIEISAGTRLQETMKLPV